MAICLLGINHKTADIKTREQFTVAETEYHQHNEQLLTHPEIESTVVLSTCNRTEYYLSTPSIDSLKKHLDRVKTFLKMLGIVEIVKKSEENMIDVPFKLELLPNQGDKYSKATAPLPVQGGSGFIQLSLVCGSR